MNPETVRSIVDRYQTRTERFGHGVFVADIVLPLSSEDLIDENEFDADERLPYWAELWPSARALARYLLDAVSLPDRALEVGCGVGLPSIALAHRGVTVTASDYYRDAVDFAQLNARRNGHPSVRTKLLDWREASSLGETFPLVVAADVLYESRNAVALAAALPSLLQPAGRLILADPGRAYRNRFLDLMREDGWENEVLRSESEPSPSGNGMQIRVDILSISRPLGRNEPIARSNSSACRPIPICAIL